MTSPWSVEFAAAEADGEGERFAERLEEHRKRFPADEGAGQIGEYPFTGVQIGFEVSEEELKRLLDQPLHRPRRSWWRTLRSITFGFTPFQWLRPRVDRSVCEMAILAGPFVVGWDRP